MKLTTVRIPYKEGDTIKLYAWGDFHTLSASCDIDALYAARKEIEEQENAYHIFMGDGAECITPSDKRWSAKGLDWDIVSPSDIDRIPSLTVEYLGAFFKPIADKCIGFHRGNHEETADRSYNRELCVEVMKEAGISPDLYAPAGAFTKLVFDDGNKHTMSIDINSAHGRQAGELDGGKLNRMKRALSHLRCDILLRGHSHSLFAVPVESLSTNSTNTRMVPHRGYVSHTGSFLRTYEEDTVCYGEVADYPPTTIGCPVFFITPSRYGPVHIRALA